MYCREIFSGHNKNLSGFRHPKIQLSYWSAPFCFDEVVPVVREKPILEDKPPFLVALDVVGPLVQPALRLGCLRHGFLLGHFCHDDISREDHRQGQLTLDFNFKLAIRESQCLAVTWYISQSDLLYTRLSDVHLTRRSLSKYCFCCGVDGVGDVSDWVSVILFLLQELPSELVCTVTRDTQR